MTILLLVSRQALAGPALIGPDAAETLTLTATAALAAFMVARPRRGFPARRGRTARRVPDSRSR